MVCLVGTEIGRVEEEAVKVCPLPKRVLSNLGRQSGGSCPFPSCTVTSWGPPPHGNIFCDGRLSPLLLFE